MDTADTIKLGNFFDAGKQVADIAKQAQARLDRQAATAFSVFDLLNARETNLSRLFADLLDPAGTHGQGDRFLHLFLEELKWYEYYSSSNLEKCVVETEHLTSEGRRIDIVLRFQNPERWLGIENKPWAGEQDEQVGHYACYLWNKDKKTKARIVYVSGDGSDPTSISDEYKRDKCECLTASYRKTDKKPSIENWIERCREKCEAERVRGLLWDLLQFIQCNFESDNAPRVVRGGGVVGKTVADFIENRVGNNPEELRLAFCIERAIPKVRQYLIQSFTVKIKDQLEKTIRKEELENIWGVCSTSDESDQHNPDKNMVKNDAWVVLYKKDWKLENHEWPASGAALNTDAANWGDVKLCVAAPNHYDDLGANIREQFREQFEKTSLGKKFVYGSWHSTPAYKNLDRDMQNWNAEGFLQEVVDENKAEKMAKNLADGLWELAHKLDGMEVFQKIADRSDKGSKLS